MKKELGSSALSDSGLVLAYLSGDNSAFDKLMSKYYEYVYRFIRKRIRDNERAKDITQEVMLRVWKSLNRFDPSKSFSTWIFTIAVNLVRNENRNMARERAIDFSSCQQTGAIPDYADPAGGPYEFVRRNEVRKHIRAAIMKLSPKKQRLLFLRYWKGRSYIEIADATNCNLGTVRSRLYKAKIEVSENVTSGIL